MTILPHELSWGWTATCRKEVHVPKTVTGRAPLTRSVTENAREHARAVQRNRIIIWTDEYGGSYFDTDDTEETRKRFGKNVVADVSWDGFVEKQKPRRAKRPK